MKDILCVLKTLKLTSFMMNGPVNMQPGLPNQTFLSTYPYRNKTLNGKMNTALRNITRKTDTQYMVTEL